MRCSVRAAAPGIGLAVSGPSAPANGEPGPWVVAGACAKLVVMFPDFAEQSRTHSDPSDRLRLAGRQPGPGLSAGTGQRSSGSCLSALAAHARNAMS